MRKSLCTHSQPTRFTLFLYNKRSRARDPPLERVPHGCKAENPRYKCQVRLSAFHPLPALLPAFFAPLVFRHRGRNCLFCYPSTWLYLPVLFLPLSTLISPLFSRIFRSPLVSQSPSLVSLRPPTASKFQLLSVSFEQTYIHFHRSKVPRWSFLSLVLLSVSPWLPFTPSSGSCPFRASAKQQTKYKRSNNAPARA